MRTMDFRRYCLRIRFVIIVSFCVGFAAAGFSGLQSSASMQERPSEVHDSLKRIGGPEKGLYLQPFGDIGKQFEF